MNVLMIILKEWVHCTYRWVFIYNALFRGGFIACWQIQVTELLIKRVKNIKGWLDEKIICTVILVFQNRRKGIRGKGSDLSGCRFTIIKFVERRKGTLQNELRGGVSYVRSRDVIFVLKNYKKRCSLMNRDSKGFLITWATNKAHIRIEKKTFFK